MAFRESPFSSGLLEGGDHGVWEWNIAVNTVFYSPLWKTMLGYRVDEITNNPDEWKSRVHPDDWPEVEIEVQRHLEGITPIYSCEHRVRCKDGSYKWILGHGKIITRDDAGTPPPRASPPWRRARRRGRTCPPSAPSAPRP